MKELESIISSFEKAKILVVGDVVLDEFVWGDVSRISPEAPVPIVAVRKETFALGGAANVAANIQSLGGRVFVASVTGDDINARRLKEEFAAKGISIEGLMVDSQRPTTLKTRIIAHSQQVVRVDRELVKDIDREIVQRILKYILSLIEEMDILIISDYSKGVVTPGLLGKIISLARKKGILTIVDPKIKNYLNYKGVNIITPNQSEAAFMTKREIETEEDLFEVGQEILSVLGCIAVLITRGESGMSLFEESGTITHIPTVAHHVYDVTGAGDTVVGVLALALAAGAGVVEASTLANYAAGIVVGEVGTATVTQEELRQAIRGPRLDIDAYHRVTPSRIKDLLGQ